MGKRRGDFFDVVGHENKRRSAAERAKLLHEGEEVGARDGIEAGTRFVENQEARAGHEGARNQDALTFALGEVDPFALREVGDARAAQLPQGGGAISGGDAVPEVELGIFAADHGIEGDFRERDGGGEDVHRHADVESEFAPVALPEAMAEDLNAAGGGDEVASQRFEQGGFP